MLAILRENEWPRPEELNGQPYDQWIKNKVKVPCSKDAEVCSEIELVFLPATILDLCILGSEEVDATGSNFLSSKGYGDLNMYSFAKTMANKPEYLQTSKNQFLRKQKNLMAIK